MILFIINKKQLTFWLKSNNSFYTENNSWTGAAEGVDVKNNEYFQNFRLFCFT